jgi:nucleotide-binding universal stress UspA family protein
MATEDDDMSDEALRSPFESELFRSVVCWVDTSSPEVARALVEEARRWVPQSGRGLVVAYVDPWFPSVEGESSDERSEGSGLLSRLRDDLNELVNDVPEAEVLLLSGPDPSLKAAIWANANGIDLMVVASHNDWFSPRRMGRFASSLSAFGDMPVLVVSVAPGDRPDPPARDAVGRLHIACCVDESGPSEAAIDAAEQFAELLEARLTLLHGIVHARALRMLGLSRVLPSPERSQRPEVARLKERASRTAAEGLVSVEGQPRDVCRWAEEHGVDLIVAGAGRHVTGTRLPGSFARKVAVHSRCPVMLVPSGWSGGSDASGSSTA